MNRREFITLLGGAAAAWPRAAHAQTKPVVGLVGLASPAAFAPMVAMFRQSLGDTGYVEGQNVTIEYRWAQGHYDRLPGLIAELVHPPVDVIVATGGAAVAITAKAATKTIPIVFINGNDPVKFGLVASLNKPGGNLTGVSMFVNELGAKRLELLRELVPKAVALDFLFNPRNPNSEFDVPQAQSAARNVGVHLSPLSATTDSEIDAAFATMVRRRTQALLVASDPIFLGRANHLVALAAHHAIPAMYAQREFAAAGGLISYGTSITEAWRQIGIYTGRILKGAKPADLPVIQPTKFDLAINLKTAKALGLTVPQALLVAADEVIE
jgi:putative ABC transport system substrate-binding protein